MANDSESVIIRDPEILSGEPVFRGTRVPFQTLLDYLEGGDTLDEFLEQFPGVSREQAIAALEAAKALILACFGKFDECLPAAHEWVPPPSIRVGGLIERRSHIGEMGLFYSHGGCLTTSRNAFQNTLALRLRKTQLSAIRGDEILTRPTGAHQACF